MNNSIMREIKKWAELKPEKQKQEKAGVTPRYNSMWVGALRGFSAITMKIEGDEIRHGLGTN
jgi:hypothetical protein